MSSVGFVGDKRFVYCLFLFFEVEFDKLTLYFCSFPVTVVYSERITKKWSFKRQDHTFVAFSSKPSDAAFQVLFENAFHAHFFIGFVTFHPIIVIINISVKNFFTSFLESQESLCFFGYLNLRICLILFNFTKQSESDVPFGLQNDMIT